VGKSDRIQHQFREILVDPDILATFHFEAESTIDLEKRDELIGLQERLIEQVHNVVMTRLTSRQSEVVQKIFYEQKTQMEVADLLGKCQTTIHKILRGNVDYLHGAKRYGGALKKINKICNTDPDIKQTLDRIAQIKLELSE
jgi:DNA-directed RNA polymerase specialized sigma24 family protein